MNLSGSTGSFRSDLHRDSPPAFRTTVGGRPQIITTLRTPASGHPTPSGDDTPSSETCTQWQQKKEVTNGPVRNFVNAPRSIPKKRKAQYARSRQSSIPVKNRKGHETEGMIIQAGPHE